MTHGASPFVSAIEAATSLEQLPKREMKVSQGTLMKEQIPLGYRDYCAHLLIPLNRCREVNYYLPWTCAHEKHGYEKCVYEDWLWRKKKREILVAQASKQ